MEYKIKYYLVNHFENVEIISMFALLFNNLK